MSITGEKKERKKRRKKLEPERERDRQTDRESEKIKRHKEIQKSDRDREEEAGTGGGGGGGEGGREREETNMSAYAPLRSAVRMRVCKCVKMICPDGIMLNRPAKNHIIRSGASSVGSNCINRERERGGGGGVCREREKYFITQG